MRRITTARLKQRLLTTSSGDMVHYTASLMGIFVVIVLLIFSISMRKIDMAKTLLQDGLVSSVLAAAVPDTRELAKNNLLTITDPAAALTNYKTALISNYGLTAALGTSDSVYLSGNVELLTFRIYNVSGSDVRILDVDPTTGAVRSDTGGTVGGVVTPDGKTIADTAVYAEIGLHMKRFSVSWPGVPAGDATQYVTLDKTVDLIRTNI